MDAKNYRPHPPETLAEINSQNKLNFHNINTEIFSNLYYIGALALLTVFPYFANTIRRRINNTKKQLKKFCQAVGYFCPVRSLLPLSPAKVMTITRYYSFDQPLPRVLIAYAMHKKTLFQTLFSVLEGSLMIIIFLFPVCQLRILDI